MLLKVLYVMARLRRAERLALFLWAVGWESHPTSRDVGATPWRWAAYKLGCRIERHGVDYVENEVVMLVSSTISMREGRGVRSD